MSRPRRDTATSSPSRPPLRLKYVEAVLCVCFALAFIVWTLLSAPSPLTPSATLQSPGGPLGLDALLPTPDTHTRSAAGQLAEAFATLTHPLLILVIIVAWVVYAYTARMRRLSVSLAIAAAGIPVQFLIALHLAHPAPGTAFADSIAAFTHAYPNAHVTAMTLAAWVLVTLARAHHRSTMVAAGNDHLVHAFAVRQPEHLLVNGAFLVADKIRGTVGSGSLAADLAGANADDAACAVQIRAGNGHQADRANADDQHRVAELDVRLFHAVKPCGHHVGEHAGLFRRNFVRHVGQIAVGVVDMEVFAEDAILEVGEFPARQHAAGVGAKTGLGLQGTPVR